MAAVLLPDARGLGGSPEADGVIPTWLLASSFATPTISTTPPTPPGLEAHMILHPLSEDQLKVDGVWPELMGAFAKIVDVGGSGRIEVSLQWHARLIGN